MKCHNPKGLDPRDMPEDGPHGCIGYPNKFPDRVSRSRFPIEFSWPLNTLVTRAMQCGVRVTRLHGPMVLHNRAFQCGIDHGCLASKRKLHTRDPSGTLLERILHRVQWKWTRYCVRPTVVCCLCTSFKDPLFGPLSLMGQDLCPNPQSATCLRHTALRAFST